MTSTTAPLGTHPCCEHCTDDPVWHSQNPPHTHETSCTTCDAALRTRAERVEAAHGDVVPAADRTSSTPAVTVRDAARAAFPMIPGRIGGQWVSDLHRDTRDAFEKGWAASRQAIDVDRLARTLAALDEWDWEASDESGRDHYRATARAVVTDLQAPEE